MQKIGYIYRQSRKELLKKAPADFLYGAAELQKRGYFVDIIEDEEIPHFSGKVILNFISSQLSRIIGLNVYQCIRLANFVVLKRLNQLNIIVATTNAYGFSLALLKYFNKIKAEVLFISMGSLDYRKNILKKIIAKKLFRHIFLAPLSKNEANYLRVEFPFIKERIFYLPFGVDADFWQPKAIKSDYVLSVGSDLSRDYRLLIKAWKPNYPKLKILTALKVEDPGTNNIQIIRGDRAQKILSHEDLKKLFQECLFVVIPMKDTIQPSGQSTCAQAMSCGKIVIMSRIAGLWDAAALKHNENCFLVSPHSIEDMRKNIEYVIKNKRNLSYVENKARETILNHFTFTQMGDVLEKIIHTVGS